MVAGPRRLSKFSFDDENDDDDDWVDGPETYDATMSHNSSTKTQQAESGSSVDSCWQFMKMEYCWDDSFRRMLSGTRAGT